MSDSAASIPAPPLPMPRLRARLRLKGLPWLSLAVLGAVLLATLLVLLCQIRRGILMISRG